MSFLAEQAGGKGTTGVQRVLDVQPDKVHQRVPLFVGSKSEVEYLESFMVRHPLAAIGSAARVCVCVRCDRRLVADASETLRFTLAEVDLDRSRAYSGTPPPRHTHQVVRSALSARTLRLRIVFLNKAHPVAFSVQSCARSRLRSHVPHTV
jgi:hypothetical protein